jgi:hypothetical protein
MVFASSLFIIFYRSPAGIIPELLDKHELQIGDEFMMLKSRLSAADKKRELSTYQEAVEAADDGMAVYVWHQLVTLKRMGNIAKELEALEAKSKVSGIVFSCDLITLTLNIQHSTFSIQHSTFNI